MPWGRHGRIRRAAAVATSTCTLFAVAVAAESAVYCGGVGETLDGARVPLSQQSIQPHADALTTHCNGACGTATSLCVYRASAQYSCDRLSTPSTKCVHGATCTYECVAAIATADAPLRWSIESTHGGEAGVLVHTAVATAVAAATITAPSTVAASPTRSSTAVLHQAIDRIDRMELPGNVVELVIRGPQSLTLELTASALETYNSLVHLEIEDVDVGSTWTKLPTMTNLKSLSLTNASLVQWPLENAVATPLTVETLDLRINPGLQIQSNAFGVQLRSLNLAHCGLRVLPPDVGAIGLLRDLTLDGNPLTQALVSTSGLPPKLEKLSLRGCGLTGTPDGLAAMHQLQTLDLAHNPGLQQISSLPFSNLKSLNVDDCGLKTFPFDLLPSSSLRNLSLSGNPLLPSAFETLTTTGFLEELDLSFTDLRAIPASILQSAIRRLNISGNAKITVTSLPPSLEQFAASNCSFTSAPSLNWTALNTVDLSGNRLTTLDGLPTTSDYTFTDLNAPLSAPQSSDTRQLRLNLSNNFFSQFPSALVSLASVLRELDLRGNPFDPPLQFTEKEVALLRKLDVLYLDTKSLDTTCTGSSKRPLSSSGYTVCVADSTPGTVRPSAGDNRNPQRGASEDPSSTTSATSDPRKAMTITAAVGGAVLTLIAVVLGILYRKSGRPASTEANNQTLPGHTRRKNNRTRFALSGSGISVPTADHDALYVVAGHPKPPQQSLSLSIGDDEEQFVDEEDGGDQLDAMLTSDSAVPTMDVASACLLEDITDDLDFIAWRVRPRHVRLVAHVATGASCFIYKALLTVVDAPPSVRKLVVAVKKLPPHQTHSDTAAIERLAQEVRVLAPFQHPKIVQFLGVSWTHHLDLQIVLEWMPDADLRTLLSHYAARKRTPPVDRWVVDEDEVSSRHAGRALRIALDIVEALVYVHSVGPHLHRQRRHWRLTSHKVVLDSNRDVAKLCDFGSSAKNRESFHHLRRWVAPEVLASDSSAFGGGGRVVDGGGGGNARADAAAVVRADVYAFGILLAELDTFALPFHRVLSSRGQDQVAAFASERSLLKAIVRGDVGDLWPLLVSHSCPQPIAELVHWCTLRDPSARPTATEIATVLRQYAGFVAGDRASSTADDADRRTHTNRASEVHAAVRMSQFLYL